jgi:serine/threonine-protein kinase HipA
MAELAVIIAGRPAGRVTQTDRTTFAYQPGYAGTPLSLAMPQNRPRHGEKTTLAWLDGLLPDNDDVRRTWASAFGVSSRNPCALLSHMGKDCPGAVQFCRPDEVDATLSGAGRLIPLTSADLAARLAALRREPSQWSLRDERWSLGGAQSKFALRWSDGWHRATGAEATTHIFKPGIAWLAGQALNEHLCLQTARRLGLRAVETNYTTFDGEACLVVTRYDRLASANTVQRLHQEDLCQALSYLPRRKYELDGGPGLASISDLLFVHADADSVWRFAQAQAFGYLIGATDGHAKNYAVVLADDKAALAPLFDVASILPYDGTGDQVPRAVAMAVAGARRFGQVRLRHWADMSRRCHVDPDRMTAEVTRLAAELPDALADSIAATELARGTELATRFQDRLAQHFKAGL